MTYEETEKARIELDSARDKRFGEEVAAQRRFDVAELAFRVHAAGGDPVKDADVLDTAKRLLTFVEAEVQVVEGA